MLDYSDLMVIWVSVIKDYFIMDSEVIGHVDSLEEASFGFGHGVFTLEALFHYIHWGIVGLLKTSFKELKCIMIADWYSDD